MKQYVFLLMVLLAGGSLSAQTKQPAAQKVESSKVVGKEGTVSGFESVLSDGNIQFSKKLSWNSATSAPSVSYFLLAKNSSFNNGKTFTVTLNKDAFDNYFQKSSPELAQKWAQLVKFAQERRLSYTEEESWIKIMNYLNSLF